VRLANPTAEGVHSETRVENEVAIISLSAAALKHIQPHVVPSIYAWGSAAAEAYGWTIQELMPGTPVDEAFESMTLEQKKLILAQMAKLLKGLQGYQLPSTITGFGGVTFNENGQILSAAMPTFGEGPWSSFEAYFRRRIEVAFKTADTSPYIQGWRANGVRDRLDAFVERGLAAQFEFLESKDEKCITHADFSKSLHLRPLTYGSSSLHMLPI
jgi:hypothetical protein